MRKVYNYLFYLIPGVLLLLASLLINTTTTYTLPQLAERSSIRMQEKLLRFNSLLPILNKPFESIDHTELNRFYEEEMIAVHVYHNDSLVYWNTNQSPLEIQHDSITQKEGLLRLKHGLYLFSNSKLNGNKIIVFCLIKPLYEIQNNYLKNEFMPWTGLYQGVKIEAPPALENTVQLAQQKLFSLSGSELTYSSNKTNNVCAGLFFLGLCLLLIAALVRIHQGISSRYFFYLLLLLLVVRIVLLYFRVPEFLLKSDLYNLQQFGDANSYWNAFLGDILINAGLCLFLTAAIYRQLLNSKKKHVQVSLYLIQVLLVFAIYHQFNQVLRSLVSNSTLNFNFLNVFTINFLSLFGVASLAICAMALYLAINSLLSLFKVYRFIDWIKLLAALIALCAVEQVFSKNTMWHENYWIAPLAIGLFAFKWFKTTNNSYVFGLYLVVMSFITSFGINTYIDKNLQAELKLLSSKLSEREDATLENEYSNLPDKIKSDKALQTLINFLPDTKDEIALLLRQKYFGSYFDRYDVEFSLFNASCNPLLQLKNPVYLNQGYFEDQIHYFSDSTFVNDLFFVRANKQYTRYIGRIKLGANTLFVIMTAKKVEELGSFPDLLLDQSQQKQDKLKGLSYGIYRGGQAVNQYGDFTYPYFLVDSLVLVKSGTGYNHFYFYPEEGTAVVISEKEKTFTEKFTLNSYFFLFFSIIGFGTLLVYSLIYNTYFRSSTLTQRIQGVIIVLLLFAMSAVGITSAKLVSAQFEKENRRQLSEKTAIIINELLGQFGAQTLFNGSQTELINQKLIDYARLFNTDISLFDRSGYLITTSQPKLYELGLVSKLLNPLAYWQLKQNETSSASLIERAGKLNYLSNYTPIYNNQKGLEGFINLPYFARQNDLLNEISGIISGLINVYVILFILSIVTGLLLSSYITQPLRLIKQQISRIALGRQNETIVWQSEDEIGKLVSEYNNMLVKLEESALLLAQSERESAWREMAKQVAHEIKNPLTPMKLNLQYLQHVMKSDSEDFKEKFEKASKGIIEQIDALANIATEFSNFAKLPGLQLQTINVLELLQNATQLFKHEAGIRLINQTGQSAILVKGDKDQCLRVLTNIFRNAIQAMEETPEPQIEIAIYTEGGKLVLSIADNGTGISEELKPVLFTPNFTTKTTGSGLGLAMVKNIMQGFGGNVWFESERGKGAIFFLEFIQANNAETI